jgi:hypothetical protein
MSPNAQALVTFSKLNSIIDVIRGCFIFIYSIGPTFGHVLFYVTFFIIILKVAKQMNKKTGKTICIFYLLFYNSDVPLIHFHPSLSI